MHIDYYRYTSSAGALAPAHLAYLFQYEAHFNLANKARFHLPKCISQLLQSFYGIDGPEVKRAPDCAEFRHQPLVSD
jgi:hypothetical protein